MQVNIRKVLRWVVNIGGLVVAVYALPEFQNGVPPEVVAVVGSFVGVINLILSVIRSMTSGEGVLKGGQ